jgi:hypothetical protein
VVLELDVAPRITVPSPHVDAVRGCLAIELGPLVYCLEQPDQPHTLADLALVADAPLEAAGAIDGLHGLPVLQASGTACDPDGWSDHPYRDAREVTSPRTVPATLTAVPYLSWGNRGSGAMRVWLPEAARPGSR